MPLRDENQRQGSGSIIVLTKPSGTAGSRRASRGTTQQPRVGDKDLSSHRSSSSNSKLSSYSAVSSASKAREGQLETVRQQSLRTAHFMPTISSAKLHVVSEVDSKVERSSASASASNSAAPVSTSAASASSRSLHVKPTPPITGAGANTSAVASSAKSMTDMFNWSSSSLEKDTDDLFKDDSRIAKSSNATKNAILDEEIAKESANLVEPLSSPDVGNKSVSLLSGKRGSIQTQTSHSTAPADNLTASSSNLVDFKVQDNVVGPSVDESAQDQTPVHPAPTLSSQGPSRQPRLSNDTEYLRFATVAGGSGRKLVNEDVASLISTEVDGAPAATSTISSESSTTSSEFLRFRSEAAGFGKRVLIADAVAGLDKHAEGDDDDDDDDDDDHDHDDDDDEGNRHETHETQHQATHPITAADQGTATSGPGRRPAATIDLRDKAKPSAPAPHQLRPSYRMTDTTCTQADANDSFFRAGQLRAPATLLDAHITQTRPPRTIGPRQISKGSSISSLTRPLEKPVPPYQKTGRMGRLLRKKKKKKSSNKNYRHASASLPPRGLPAKGDDTGSRPRLSTVLSERIVTALSGSITSFSSMRNLGSTERRRSFSDAQLIAAIPRPSEIEDVHTEDGPMHPQPTPMHSDSAVPTTKPIEGAEPAGATDIAPDAQSARSEDSSADLRKGDDMMLRWKQLGVDIATKQLDAAGEYYEKGDLLRARACYAQVAAMDRPLDGDDDDTTVVLSGLVGEAKSMLVRIDSDRSLLQSDDPPNQASMTEAHIDESNTAVDDKQGSLGQNDAATDTTNEDNIFASVHKAFFSENANNNDGNGPAPKPATSSQPTRFQPMPMAPMVQSEKLAHLLQEGLVEREAEDPECRSAYSAKDIENMANDLVSLRSQGAASSQRSSVASIHMVDSINLTDIANLEEDDDDNAWVGTEMTPSPPESSMTTSVGTGTSDQVAINGQRINDVDTNLPTAVALLQEAGAPYTIPMAPPSNQGLLASDSTLSASLNTATHLHAQKQIVEGGSHQLAGSDTSEAASRASSRSESVQEPPPPPAVGEACPAEIIQAVRGAAEVVSATEGDKAAHIPTGEDTNEPPQRQSSAEALAQTAAHDKLEQDAADADEPVIYLRHNSSGISVVSDMIESTASSWLKMQASNPSRENSTSSKGDGTNPSLTIVGEELVIEDGLDPTEALKRAAEQERLVADQQLEEQVDAIEREAAEAARRKEEKKSRRNTKDSMRLHDQGVVYYNQGDFEGARSCFASALKMRFQVHGQSSLDTCLTQEKLGDTLVKLDKIEEAHWQYLMAFRGLQQCNLPKDNLHTSRILVSLGDVFFSAADYSRALKYYEKSIRFHAETSSEDVCGGLMKCALGECKRDQSLASPFGSILSTNALLFPTPFCYLEAHESMAKNEWIKGEVDMCRFHVRELLWLLTYESPAARALFETKGAVKKAASDSQRFRVDTGAQIITVSSSSESDEDTSFSYIEESKALLVSKGSTPSDLDILRVLDSTAKIHAERGELVNAYKCYMEKLTYLRSRFPTKKRAMAEAAYNVGAMCNKMGRHQEAIMYFSEALTLHQRTTRQKDEDKIALLLKCLGSSYLSIKNPILALVHFKEHQALCGVGGEKELLSVMGIARGKQFDLVRSLDCYAKVLDIEASEDQWLAQHNPLGPLIETLEQIFASPKTFQAGQSVNEKARDCQDLKTILINLGLAQLIRNPKTAQPTEYIRDLCHYLNEDGCIDGVDFTRVLFSMGNILLRRNRYREAIVYYEKCIASYTEEDRDTSNDYVDLLTNLGTAHLRNGDHDKSFKHFRSALREVKRARRRSSSDMSSPENEVDGLNHFSVLLQQARDEAKGRENDENVLTLRHIIALYLCMDHRASEAVELLLDIERRMIKLVGEEHPDILQLRVDLSVAQLISGSPQIARATYERAIGPVSQGRIPDYHPFYTQYNRLIQVHYPTPVMPVVAHQPIEPVQKPLPVKTDFVPRMA